jgi:hypothetical protein
MRRLRRYVQDMRRFIDTLHAVPEPPRDQATREALLPAFHDLRGSGGRSPDRGPFRSAR